ncbi:secreted RxLR effector protein 78-like [Typha latifolia]|uniref:secreted RxLR effector protein 78-like n=1 Tax=Typha latifolia TaxID=4733 RepID=UPI003C2DE5E7
MVNDKGGNPIMMIKMDMEKAYDRVSWQAVIGVLQRMGFPPRWCNWVQACIASPRFALLINGCPTKWIMPRSGLRQGDPLFPYLFIIVTQVLSRIINEKVDQGLLSGYRVKDVHLSHLLYADDLLLMAEASATNAKAF